jgi:Mg-chelatase subunit ChlD
MAMTSALDRVANRLARNESKSLASRVKNQDNEDRIVLSDTSGSMAEMVDVEKRKIDALRNVIYDLKGQGYTFKHIVFGSSVELREDVPEPMGGTPLTEALKLAREHHPGRVIVISDGIPDVPSSALDAARELGCPIDCFYVGPRPSLGEVFMSQLADVSKGNCYVGDLGKGIKALEGEIKKSLLAIGDGKAVAL